MVLNILRSKKFAKKILLGLLVVIIPAFVLWGAGNVSRKKDMIGYIGSHKIHLDDLAESLQGVKVQIILTYFQNFETVNKILKNRALVNSMAWERLVFLNAAKKERFKVTNKDVMTFIAQHPLFSRNGVFDYQTYSYILKNNLLMEPRQFEDFVRENILVRLMRQHLLKDVTVTDEEALAFYKKHNDAVNLSYVFVNKDLFKDQVTVSEEEVKKYYEENANKFVEQEKIDIDYIEFSYESPEQKDELKDTIYLVLDKVRKTPENFKKIATEHDVKSGSTGPFSRLDVIPGVTYTKEIYDTVFDLDANKISSPIYSSEEKGKAYIFMKTEIIPLHVLSFNETKSRIRTTLRDKQLINLALEKARELFEKLNKKEITLEEAATDVKENIKTVADIKSSGYIENVGQAQRIVFRALEVGAGNLLSPFGTLKGALIVRVDKVIDADKTVFEEQKETLQNSLLSKKQMKTLDDWFKANAMNAQLFKDIQQV